MRARFVLSTFFTILSIYKCRKSILFGIFVKCPYICSGLRISGNVGTTRERKDSTVRKQILQTAFPQGVPFLIYQNADYNSD